MKNDSFSILRELYRLANMSFEEESVLALLSIWEHVRIFVP